MHYLNLENLIPYLNLLILQEPPFLFVRGRTRGTRQTNNQFGYEGYIPELLDMIKVVLEEEGIDFNYKLELMSEGNYGRKDSVSGQWDGMIQELIEDVSIRKYPFNEIIVNKHVAKHGVLRISIFWNLFVEDVNISLLKILKNTKIGFNNLPPNRPNKPCV